MKKIRYAIEAALLQILFLFFRILPAKTASNIGGWLGRMIGPNLATSRKALRNLEMALPNLTADEQKQAIKGMWDNLGRIMAEYPHLATIGEQYTKIEGGDILSKIFEDGEGAIFFGGHIGNFEANCAATLKQFDQEIDITYRAPNNPWSAKLLDQARTLDGRLKSYAKSREGGKDLLQATKDKRYIGILIDQKYNEGVPIEFFGVEAMTNPIFVQLCQKYKCPLVPIRNQRLDGIHCSLTVYEPLKLFDENDQPLPVEEVIAEAHGYLEKWIKERPDQWLWLHRRWDSAKLS